MRLMGVMPRSYLERGIDRYLYGMLAIIPVVMVRSGHMNL